MDRQPDRAASRQVGNPQFESLPWPMRRLLRVTLIILAHALIISGLMLPWLQSNHNSISGHQLPYGSALFAVAFFYAWVIAFDVIGITGDRTSLELGVVAAATQIVATVLFFLLEVGRIDNSIADAETTYSAGYGVFLTLSGTLFLLILSAAGLLRLRTWNRAFEDEMMNQSTKAIRQA